MSELVALTISQAVHLSPVPPFHFDATVHKPAYFPSSDNIFLPGSCWQTMTFEGQVLGLKLENAGSVDQPGLTLTVYSRSGLADDSFSRLVAEVRYRYDLDSDLSEFLRALAGDDLLAPVMARWRGMRVSNPVSLYEYLIIAIVLQNATVRRSVQMMENLFGAYGSRVAYDGKELSAFWPPEVLHQAPEQELRALKVGYRARSLKRISEPFVRGEIDELALRRLGKEELKKRLLALYGIGPASVWYLLFGVFHHYDAFEHISPWEQKIYSRLLFGEELVPGERILAEVERRWGRWKMLAADYVFEDLFWRRKNEPVPWLEALIRL